MAYGSPSGPEEVRPYLEDVRGGRPVSDEAVAALAERYRRIGGRSPLDRGHRGAARRARAGAGYAGLRRHEALAAADRRGRRLGARRRRDERSSGSCSRRTTRGSRSAATATALDEAVAGAPILSSSRAGTTLRASSSCWPTACETPTPGSSSPHTRSWPWILDEGDPYKEQLLETSRLVAERAGLERWSFAFQSASATGEPWLGPDVLEEVDRLHADGVERVAVTPVGFVSDHLEIRWTPTSRRRSARPS